ncbi:hypothetical protein D9611_008060 [Ephemerocybe angulata]|uniref:Kinesin motor domain-containing protein n=1 Tax=Ephemerocybe angulata TaxID=980116 RepID=A0A8H5BZD0_9AGAR|nr:hypothetical protein D9611_008060 [Tulosesus angulatus]
MSRLPRLRSSSPDRRADSSGPTLAATAYVNTRKRKSAIEEDEEQDTLDELIQQPRKFAALGNARPTRSRTAAAPAAKANAPLNPSKNAGNLRASNSNLTSSTGSESNTKVPTLSSSNFGKGIPKTVTRPRPPTTLARSTTRGTSAPPVSQAGPSRAIVRPGAKPATSAAATARGGRTLRSGVRKTGPEDKITTIQSQLATLEAARQADAERLAEEMASERSKVSELQNNHLALSKQLSEAKTQELNHRRELVTFSDEMDEMRKKHTKEVMELEMDLRKKEREAREVTEDLRVTRNDLERERLTVENLRTAMSTQSQTQLTLSAENQALHAQLSSLQRQLESMNLEVADMKELVEEKEKAVIEMKKEVFESETIRRKLHNTILELKGNIRVFCRVRPVLSSDLPALPSPEEEERVREELKAKMDFPDNHDHKEIVLHSTSESAMGIERKDVYNFGFDRVFEPESTQAQVFEEISQLAQSCIDGYNVCIFAYGQTGSGKSFTMEGGPTDSTAGMIPRAVEQVFRVSEEMKSKGWEYKLEGQFLEIYNEAIHDLLIPSTAPDADKKKHDIKHDPKTGRTSVTEVTVVPLQSPSQVRVLLARAQSRRSVAATLMNERSSRSHSVFTLRISGVNVAGEKKERVKETQSINKSLSALGDVISALGERGSSLSGKEVHIPYRNSKLTYLLQNSLSGSSKTLMVLNLSPLAAHMNESLTSLRFATKVNNTNIGTAKKLAKAS